MKKQNLKINKPVAILYDRKKDPSCKCELGRKILAAAKEEGISIYEDPELVEVLAALPGEDEIPLEFYQATVEILTFIYKLNKIRS
jgi:flagellar biosynthesis protein